MTFILAGCQQPVKKEIKKEGQPMQATITINNHELLLGLDDNETTRQLIKGFPLSITMQDLHHNEKYYYLDESLTSNPQKVNQIHKGDLMLFQDNCLVLFYKDFKTSFSYTLIGHIEENEDLESIVKNQDIKVEFHLK